MLEVAIENCPFTFMDIPVTNPDAVNEPDETGQSEVPVAVTAKAAGVSPNRYFMGVLGMPLKVMELEQSNTITLNVED